MPITGHFRGSRCPLRGLFQNPDPQNGHLRVGRCRKKASCEQWDAAFGVLFPGDAEDTCFLGSQFLTSPPFRTEEYYEE